MTYLFLVFTKERQASSCLSVCAEKNFMVLDCIPSAAWSSNIQRSGCGKQSSDEPRKPFWYSVAEPFLADYQIIGMASTTHEALRFFCSWLIHSPSIHRTIFAIETNRLSLVPASRSAYAFLSDGSRQRDNCGQKVSAFATVTAEN